MAPKENLSQAEIWDDAALVDSWNDALEEYKKYHSIQARGEDIQEVLKAGDNERNRVDDEMLKNEQPSYPAPTSDAKEVSIENASSDEKDLRVDEAHAQSAATQCDTDQATEAKHPALPQHLIGQVHNEGLKNLLMSWYYAGYYTGLYEGQLQGAGSKSANQTG